MNKIEVAKELSLAFIKVISISYKDDTPHITAGVKAAELYNSIYHNLEISDDEDK